MDRMNFIIWVSGGAEGFYTTGTCAYFDIDKEVRAIKKEWKRNEVVSLYAMTPWLKTIPKDLRKYFEERPEHSVNLTLRKMQFEGNPSFPEDSVALRYNISLGGYMFTQSIMAMMHLYSEEGQDYIDMEFALNYVTWCDTK